GTEKLPVIDLTKTYPKKEQNLRDMADIEYIPLETTDDVLLGERTTLSAVTDNYMLIHDWERGDIFVFNRAGKIVSHFNHKGQSGREYQMIGGVSSNSIGTILDEKKEEIFVCSNSIQVFSLTGEYKRSLPINTIRNNSKVFNFDDETLLLYDDFVLDMTNPRNAKTNPYSLISKKDGSLIAALDIYLSKRYSTMSEQEQERGKTWTTMIIFPSNMCYGNDFVIADMSSDTLYLLTQNRKLTPLLTRKPSVRASSDPLIIWTTLLTTDKFILFGKVPINLSLKGGGGKAPIYMYEFGSNEISEVSILDSDVIRNMNYSWNRQWNMGQAPAVAKNMTAQLIWPGQIINAYKAKRLNKEMVKFAKTLDADDNPMVRIVKFK
ncbi:MAG: 6-bladed beta-propeller, partial [Tannerella sp.]|nr:6-bladed beta-propeller [Tannerella sp.]